MKEKCHVHLYMATSIDLAPRSTRAKPIIYFGQYIVGHIPQRLLDLSLLS